jgi:hypothetical protein
MYCGSVKVVCEYNGSIVDVYEILESFGSVVVICEYNGSEVDVYVDELKEGACGCRKELWVESGREESIRWNDMCVSVEDVYEDKLNEGECSFREE